jgi:hypothetical protein
MSYIRFNEDGSDVYVFLNCDGYLSCCGCKLDQAWQHYSTADMLDHLRAHIGAGHCVPDHAFAGLKEHAAENDEWIANYCAGEQDKAGRDA